MWLSFLAIPVEAGPAAAPQRRRVDRTLSVRFARQTATAVHELHLAPGAATLVRMPGQIRPGGVVLTGAEDRVTWNQHGPDLVILVALAPVGASPIPLTVTTVDGRRFPFQLTTLPDAVDGEVTVAALIQEDVVQGGPGAAAQDPLLPLLLGRTPLAVLNTWPPPEEPSSPLPSPDPFAPRLDTVARWGKHLYLRIWRQRASPSQPWKLLAARVEGATGPWLRVLGLHWAEIGWTDINVIVAEAPQDGAGGYALESLHLTDQHQQLTRLDQRVVFP